MKNFQKKIKGKEKEGGKYNEFKKNINFEIYILFLQEDKVSALNLNFLAHDHQETKT